MGVILLIGIVSAVAAGFICVWAHGYADEHKWEIWERYTAGALIWLLCFAPPLFAALPIEQAVLLYAMAWLIIGGMGFATWACYQKPIAMPEDDDLSAKIDKELNR